MTNTISNGVTETVTSIEPVSHEVIQSSTEQPKLRPGLRGGHSIDRPRKSIVLTILAALVGIYALIPLIYIFMSATKNRYGLSDSFGLWFADDFALFSNIREVFTYQNGIFGRWFLNTLLYVIAGAGGATLLALLGGYALAKYNFPGKRAVFAIVIGAVAVPGTALAVPTFLMFARMGITNTPWAVIIPSLISPFGLYLMWTFSQEAVPNELLEAARVDGAGPFRTFFQVALPLLAPGLVTVLLFAVVATWNNYFLPLIMLQEPRWFPLTIGLNTWNNQAFATGGEAVFHLVITGALITIIPLIVAFLLLQRYWQSGLSAGSVKG